MKASEVVYREIAASYAKKVNRFTQLGLSKELSLSLSVINTAVANLERIGAARVELKYFYITDFEKLMMYWATHRNVDKDVVYATRANMPVREIEVSMPDGIAFTAYTAYKLIFRDVPSDYGEVYVYAGTEALDELKQRFREFEGIPNLVVLKADRVLERNIKERKMEKSSVPAVQVFVDLWNINTWMAKEYKDALSKRIMGE